MLLKEEGLNKPSRGRKVQASCGVITPNEMRDDEKIKWIGIHSNYLFEFKRIWAGDCERPFMRHT
jgi:hypothetical protein